MEIDPISPVQAADKLATWLAVRDALEAAAAQPGDVPLPVDPLAEAANAAGSELETGVPLSEPALPGADSDFSREAATVQTAWRAPPQSTDVPHAATDPALANPATQGELSVPSALLAPAALTGLRTEPGLGFQLPMGPPQWPASSAGVKRREPRRQRDRPQHAADDRQPPVGPEPPQERDPEPPATLLDAADAGAWCDELSHALHHAMTARVAPQALLAASEQWRRGRCVVLACPQAEDPAGPAWAFVLWPSKSAAPNDGTIHALALHGLRVEARLVWSAPPRPGQWCHVRVIKEHHPRHGRQLVALDDGARPPADRPVPCEVQLGPVLARSLRWCEVRVHVQAAQRFWAALGQQWSVQVVVSARPLLAPLESAPC